MYPPPAPASSRPRCDGYASQSATWPDDGRPARMPCPDAVKPGFHGVGTHWIRGFMTFELARSKPQHADGGLAHLDLADLAACRHREVLDDPNVTRDLVVGQLAVGECPDVGRCHQWCAGTKPYPGHDLFTESRVRHPDDLDVLHVLVGVQELLDLAWRDVLPAPDDHVLEPAGDGDIAVRVHGGQVTGVHPARGVDGLGGLAGLPPIAEHHRVPARAQLTRNVAWHGDTGFRIDDLDLDVRMYPPDRGYPAVQRVVDPGLRRDRGGFGHSVDDGDLGHAHPVHDLLHDFDRAGCAAHAAGAQRAQVVGVEARLGQLGDEHGGH